MDACAHYITVSGSLPYIDRADFDAKAQTSPEYVIVPSGQPALRPVSVRQGLTKPHILCNAPHEERPRFPACCFRNLNHTG